jgi:hypothetical protein
MNRKNVKIALIMLVIALFGISLLPIFSPVMFIIKQLIGSIMIGWWTGMGIAKIWYK